MKFTLFIISFLFVSTSFAGELYISCVGDYDHECMRRRAVADQHVARYNKAKKEYLRLKRLCTSGCPGGVKAQRNAYAQMLKGYQQYTFPSYNITNRKNRIQSKIRTYRKGRFGLKGSDNLPLEMRPSREDKLFGLPATSGRYEDIR